MPRKKKPKASANISGLWLITFGDLVTLLLTFFVLILSMSSMDRTFLTKITMFKDDLSVLTYKGAGRVPRRIRLIVDLLERPWEVIDKQKRIKDLLYPEEDIPPEIERSTLLENLRILARPEGVALVLSNDLLFAPGGYELSDEARYALSKIAEVMEYMQAPTNIAGYTDTDPGGRMDNYTLSGERSLSVLEYFLDYGMRKKRFSVSGYGPHWAVADNDTAEGKALNRRVEILLKTTPWLGVPTN
jgi:chemotaxis protein MotB